MDFNNLIHKGIMDNDRWINLPLAMQMGNIGSEIAKLKHWKEKQNEKNMEAAWDRALELIDLTVYGLQKKALFTPMREVLMLREVFCDYAGDFGFYGVSGQELIDYCTEFMLIA